jgi:hypothetical protein
MIKQFFFGHKFFAVLFQKKSKHPKLSFFCTFFKMYYKRKKRSKNSLENKREKHRLTDIHKKQKKVQNWINRVSPTLPFNSPHSLSQPFLCEIISISPISVKFLFSRFPFLFICSILRLIVIVYVKSRTFE